MPLTRASGHDSQRTSRQTSEDDTALLVAALNHYWTWLDGRFNRAFQIINYYLVATAILFTAYISAINGKHYGIAAALALAGLGLTAPMALAVLGEVNAGARAAPGLMELHNRMAIRLRIEPIHLAQSRPEEHRGASASPSRSDCHPSLSSAGCSTP